MRKEITYNIDWRKALDFLIKSYVMYITIDVAGIIGSAILLVYLNYIENGSWIKTFAVLALVGIIFGTFLIMAIKFAWDNKKYSFVKKLTLYNDRFVYQTPKGLKFTVMFENVGFIDMADGILSNGKYYPYTTVNILYYNERLNRCILILIERKVGIKVVEKYKEYAKSKGLKPCPIVTGNLKSYAEVEVPIKKLKKSPFCRRR